MELLRNLTRTIITTVEKSDEIAKAVYEIRAAGLDIELDLAGTMSVSPWPVGAIDVEGHGFLGHSHFTIEFEA